MIKSKFFVGNLDLSGGEGGIRTLDGAYDPILP